MIIWTALTAPYQIIIEATDDFQSPVENQIDSVVAVAKIPQEEFIEEVIEDESVLSMIERISLEYDVEPDLAVAIAQCESELNPYAKNPTSSAEGVFQFLDSTWVRTLKRMGLPPETKKTDLPESIEAGLYLLREDGTTHWLESRYCWNK